MHATVYFGSKQNLTISDTDRRTSTAPDALIRRDTEVLRMRKCSVKRKGGLMAMLSGLNFLYTVYTCNNIDFFKWASF